jgi:hypothetical protein
MEQIRSTGAKNVTRRAPRTLLPKAAARGLLAVLLLRFSIRHLNAKTLSETAGGVLRSIADY